MRKSDGEDQGLEGPGAIGRDMKTTTQRDALGLQRILEKRLEGEVRFDPFIRAMYSTDASNHLIEPLGVVMPRSADDLSAVVETAAEFDVPVLPRGAGTSLGGQAVGRALIMDCGRHLNQIHRIDREAGVAEVGPGVVYATLNATASKQGLMFGPDPASGDRATLGGMIGNNATGAHSIRYGMTGDHLLEADVILADGSRTHFAGMTPEAARIKAKGDSLEARIYQGALEIQSSKADAIRKNWPRTWRRASGYSIHYLIGYAATRPPAWFLGEGEYPPHRNFNIAPLLCGSEGTLAIVHRATVRLVPKPRHTVLAIIPFDSTAQACDAVPGLLESDPAAIELIPRTMIERARQIPNYARRLGFVQGDPHSIIVVEFAGDDPSALLAAAKGLNRPGSILESTEAQADLWAVRKAGLGLLLSVPGDTKPITFIEDVAVPVEHLGGYVREMDRIIADQGTSGEWYAHASAGCLHLRPMINLKTDQGLHQVRAIADSAVKLAIRMRGSVSGEHGDGLSHTEFNAKLFGEDLMDAFRQLKHSFDPEGRLNPGTVVPQTGPDAPRHGLDRNLRYGPVYSTIPVDTVFAYHREGDLAHAVESCSGLGICRKADGVMCPSYQATRDEMHSTRGRANALRSALSGRLPPGALTSREMHDVLDLCLECKGCKAECPTAVDMARVKAEFLNLYQAEHGVPLRSRMFAEIAAVSRIMVPLAGAANATMGAAPVRWLMEKILGIARERSLPRFSSRTLRRMLNGREPMPRLGHRVVLFADTFSDTNTPEIGTAAVRVLEAAGYGVEIAHSQVCCGRPMVSKGLLDRAREMAAANINALFPYADQGIPIVGLEPSCLLMLRDEYLEFFPNDKRAAKVASAARMVEEFMTEQDAEGVRPLERLDFKRRHAAVVFHGHCHVKASIGSRPMVEMLEAAAEQVEEIDSGCCGMAGSFGYEAEHYGLSMQIGEMRLFPAVRSGVERGVRLAAAGTSCRTQILDGTGARIQHPIQVVADAIGDPA
jgi:FAD/FMN-containing dehydrogenase/Fe-S oxidoreductase